MEGSGEEEVVEEVVEMGMMARLRHIAVIHLHHERPSKAGDQVFGRAHSVVPQPGMEWVEEIRGMGHH